MNTRAFSKNLLSWLSFGLTLTILCVAIFQARAQTTGGGTAGMGPCTTDAAAACFTCADSQYYCTGGASPPDGYTAGEICGNTNTTGCQNATFECGNAFDCTTKTMIAGCGIGVGCASPVPNPAVGQ